MKSLPILLLLTVTLHISTSTTEKCYDKETQCHSTNYQSYVECVRRRHKRSLDCETTCESGNCIDQCDDCDCNSCGTYSNCRGSCNSCCGSCCNNYVACRTNHCCHKTCHAQCQSSGCRSTCRRNCFDTIKQTNEEAVAVGIQQGASVANSSSQVQTRHNITTIINLNNVINNTNIIDVPITLNNTNQQNITLYEAQNDLVFSQGGSSTTGEKCCLVISPRRCEPTKEFPFMRCFHLRSKQCGEFCTASIVHKEQQQVCQSNFPGAPPNCQQLVTYIPQPQPRCSYQSTWPYVSCGIQKSASCGGCYSHYVDQTSKSYLNCPFQCYDDGFGAGGGSYYRQGPVYRPGYSHVPMYGSNGDYSGYGGSPGYPGYGYGGMGAGLGGYGNVAGGYGGAMVGQPMMAFGSWSPGVAGFGPENITFMGGTNATAVLTPFDPMIQVGPQPNYWRLDEPLREAREVEIEVDYEPNPHAQAEVKIRTDKKKDNGKNASLVAKEYVGSTVKSAFTSKSP